MWVYGKKKKGVYPAPSMGQDTRLCTSLWTQKKSGYRPPDFPDSDTRSMKPCFIVPVGVLPSLRRPALLLSSVLGQKTELTSQSPVFSGLSEFSSKITQSSLTITVATFPASISAIMRLKLGLSNVTPDTPSSMKKTGLEKPLSAAYLERTAF